MRIIGLVGAYGSGKDTVGQYLVDRYDATRYAFADKLKQVCSDIFGIPLNYFNDTVLKNRATHIKKLRNCLCGSSRFDRIYTDTYDCESCGRRYSAPEIESYWSNRSILQYIGTEGFRTVDPQVWIRFVERAIKANLALDPGHIAVVTDVRFIEEVYMIKNLGGEIWEITRPGHGTDVGHASEHLQANPDFISDVTVKNDGTLDQLKIRVREAFSSPTSEMRVKTG